MGSLNGDVVVMRNGRTTSQVSVYNYPEHLNPFYEDDQHKRLRFWKINKKDNEGRRNSFSIANLKDMWAFKSFRMKKKSSTLGINKTSESPPLLRRDYALDNGWNTFDHRLRASNTPSINGDSFQRNAIYRSSLQTLPTTNDRIGLNRNDGYRSTIQVPRSSPHYPLQQKQQQQLQQTMGVSKNRRYVYGGSVTPQPLRNSRADIGRGQYEYDSDSAMIRGSSQSSMVSTNPFESDEDDENADINSIGMRSAINGSTTTLTSRTPRKKRRAPAPPTPTHCRINGTPLPTIHIEPSHDNTQDELRIKEDMDIANLTAEIESFVKTKNNDNVEVTQKDDTQTPTATTRNSLDNRDKIMVRKAEGKTEEISAATNDSCNTAFTAEEDRNEAVKKSNGQVKTETVNATMATDVAKPEENETKAAIVSNQVETKIDESKEIKTNGATPKKPINNSATSLSDELQPSAMVTDLCIKERRAEELPPQKPVPLKRQTKPEAEVGQVECIHVHVESPKATPRKDHPNSLSSFKSIEAGQSTEKITTKTAFVLTSPPAPRRNRQQMENGETVTKEIVKIVGTTTENKRTNELNIKEERINVKPEISVKPTLSPKAVTKESNGRAHGFAEIHKPARRNNQHAQSGKVFHDESISPPFLQQQKTKEEEKIFNIVNFQGIASNTEKAETVKPAMPETVDNLKITESNSNGNIEPSEEEEGENKNEIKETTTTTTFKSASMQKRDDEYDFLYRPKPASQMEWKRSTLAPLETNIPPEKRKSVKDIIESINRSQRLLNAAANKDFTVLQNQNATNNNADTGPTTTTHHSSVTNNNNNLNKKLQILDGGQTGDLQSHTNGEELAAATNSPSPSLSNCNNECTEELHELDNSEIFQKCKVKKEVYDYRETSPITSNLDWNPVPKPKRTKAAHE